MFPRPAPPTPTPPSIPTSGCTEPDRQKNKQRLADTSALNRINVAKYKTLLHTDVPRDLMRNVRTSRIFIKSLFSYSSGPPQPFHLPVPALRCFTVVRQVKKAMSNTADLVELLTDARAWRDWAVCDVKYPEPQLHFPFKVSKFLYMKVVVFSRSMRTSFHLMNFYN